MHLRLLTLLLSLLSCSVTQISLANDEPEETIEQQRAAFRAVVAEVEKGNWQPVQAYEKLLQDYVLWPDLRAIYLRATLKSADHREIKAFLDTYGVLKPARELRYRYAMQLAAENRLPEYLDIYRQFYQGLEIANLDCLALQAEIESGQAMRVTKRARDMWLVGKSQAKECDPVFGYLQDKNLLTNTHYAERFNLAIESRQFSLARYLAGSLDARNLEEANEWLRAQKHPDEFVSAYLHYADTNLTKQLFAYAIERLALNDPAAASRQWQKLSSHFSYTTARINEVDRHIALWVARDHLPQAAEQLAALPPAARDTETGRWLIRARLMKRQWPQVIDGVDALPADEREKDEWQYWKAVALRESGRDQEAYPIFEKVATERSYHGFLAADAISLPYALNESRVVFDPEIATSIAERPGLVRARELFFVGLEGRGRSEWDSAVRLMTSEEQKQAALLADSWGWHSRAISTVAVAGEFDDLRVRYPLPWRETFERYAGAAGVSDSWAYGIARSESLFMRDIRSSAGAVGVMQLMPETGRLTAREMQLPWSGQATLTDSSANIRLGTYYLGKMFSRFGDNRVLATAAYNAGPLRVEAWLPQSGSLDSRIWIENIPFNETRGYVRRVLADDAIFYWRMTGRQQRLSAQLPQIAATMNQSLTVNSD